MVDLKEIVEDYRSNFHNRSCTIKTNYNGLLEFEVAFYLDGLPHLLGLHYVTGVKYASSILKQIESDNITANKISKHREFNKKDVKNRILLYPFLYEVFKDRTFQTRE